MELGDTEEVTAAHKVYLTFDDGPSIYTDEILDILDAYDVKATFFVVGKDTDRAREAMREIVARGHTLGMHSYSHKYSQVYASLEAFEEDFVKIREYIYEVTGEESHVYRFPGGSSNTVSDLDRNRSLRDRQDRGILHGQDLFNDCGQGLHRGMLCRGIMHQHHICLPAKDPLGTVLHQGLHWQDLAPSIP